MVGVFDVVFGKYIYKGISDVVGLVVCMGSFKFCFDFFELGFFGV